MKKKQLLSESIKNNLVPIEYKFKDDIKPSNFCFTIFNALSGQIILIYSHAEISIISFDLLEKKIISKIVNAHSSEISYFDYNFDQINKKDLILSLSSNDQNIKLWEVEHWDSIFSIKNIYSHESKISTCFIKDNDNYYIVVGNYSEIVEPIKIYDMKGSCILDIFDSENPKAYRIANFYDNNINYIIISYFDLIFSYNFNEKKYYQKYIAKLRQTYNKISITCNVFIKKKKILLN